VQRRGRVERPTATETSLVQVGRVERTILILRGHRVILDSDLAALYGVETRRLNEQVRRNLSRFPPDFAVQLTSQEFNSLISQIATSNAPQGRGGRRKLHYAFTEHGALVAASVLNSPRAVEMSIAGRRRRALKRNLGGAPLGSARRPRGALKYEERRRPSHLLTGNQSHRAGDPVFSPLAI